MPKQHVGVPDPFEKKKLPVEPEIDYSPKTYTFRENLMSFGKMAAIAVILFALIWILEKYLFA